MDENAVKQIVVEVVNDRLSNSEMNGGRVTKHVHNGQDSLPVNFTNLGDILIQKVTTASTAPTDTPLDGTLRYQYDATNYYQWNYLNQNWKGVQLGASSTGQYQTTLTEDNNTGSTITTYTQTISGLSFAPQTVFFTGSHDIQTILWGIDGIATKNGNITTGNCRYFRLGGTSSIAQSTSKLGTTNANDYFTVSAWNSDGVTISKTLFGSYGSGNDKFAGILTLLG